ncbi:MAG: YcxB family protein [Clostridium sp.]|jgi:hypothetical protein|nr:YcxB family protein [Clostridium sp.]
MGRDKADFIASVKVDGKIFRRFALFDTFHRRWLSPALFMGIMLIFSFLAFSRVGKTQQAALLGGVLSGLGVLLPAAYFLNFYLSVCAQVKKLGLAVPRYAYTLWFDGENGVSVSAGKEELFFRWNELFAVYRAARCIYLYTSPDRAYLLPDGQIEGGADELWTLLSSRLPKLRFLDIRRRRGSIR